MSNKSYNDERSQELKCTNGRKWRAETGIAPISPGKDPHINICRELSETFKN